MFFELIATVVAGGFAAGVMMLLNRLTGRRLPRWLIPVAAGLTMIGYTIAMEYTWYERTRDALLEGIEIVAKHDASNFWRPWTYFAPVTDRFVALDTDSIRGNEAVPHQRMVDQIRFARWQAPQVIPMVVDCDTRLGAPLLDTVTFADSGAVENALWDSFPEGDTTLSAICKEI